MSPWVPWELGEQQMDEMAGKGSLQLFSVLLTMKMFLGVEQFVRMKMLKSLEPLGLL